jgi:hypothetical protein
MPFEPKLPDGVSLPPGHRIDVADPRYVALHSLAEREGWSQTAFSETLAIEGRRVSAEYERARAAAPAPAPAPAAKVDFAKMTTSQQFAHALQQSAAKPRGS